MKLISDLYLESKLRIRTDVPLLLHVFVAVVLNQLGQGQLHRFTFHTNKI
jgi:hypothetical protein